MAAGFILLDQCRFLIPYKTLLLERNGATILLFSTVLFVNIYAALYFGVRKLHAGPAVARPIFSIAGPLLTFSVAWLIADLTKRWRDAKQ